MPPKPKKGAAKKAEQKKQTKLIEDKTFGLKNKNKSKSVQKYIATVEKSVKSSDRGQGEAAKEKKKQAKEAKKAQEAELAALFNEALAGGAKQGGAAGKSKAVGASAIDTKVKVVQETIIIEEGEKTLEDKIEEQRTKLRNEGKKGTPVNEETLKKWKADRKARKLEEERRKVEAEMKKKGKGKGLSILSGRALFDYDSTLFQDDADAADNETMALRDEATGPEDGGDEVRSTSYI
ncbi:unnamed protein product [Discosporangium mesarthrocarpum]